MRAELFTVSIASLVLPVFLACTPVTRNYGLDGLGGGGGFGGGFGGGSGASPSTGGAAGTGGGDGGPQTTPPYVAGSRLHAHVQDAGGGAVVLEYWVDEQLQVPCTFLPTTDGKFHCAPKQGNSIAYSDASCTTKVGVLSTCAALSPYVVDQSTTPVCDDSVFGVTEVPVSTVYAIGQKAGTAALYTFDQSTPPQCTAGSTTQDYYQITVAELSGFVSATLAQENRDGRLYAEFLDGSDGSRQMTGNIYDHSMGDLPCSLDISGTEDDPSFLCLPGVVASADAEDPSYDDPACTMPVASEQSFAACKAPQVVVSTPQQTACTIGGGNTYYQPGTDVTAGNVCTMDSTGACSCHTVTDGTHYFTLGAPIPASTFSALAIGKTGTGRLQTEFLTTPAGGQLTPPSPNGFFDTMGATTCQVRPFSDGVLRCVPQTVLDLFAGNQPTYSDPNCTTQVVTQYVNPPCTAPTVTGIVQITSATDACSQDTVTATYAVGGMYTGAQVYNMVVGAGCLSEAVQPNAVYYQIGANMDPSAFATVTETTE